MFSERMLSVARSIGLSQKAQEVLAEMINGSLDNSWVKTLETCGEEIKEEVKRCLIEASSMIRRRIDEIGSLDALEKICKF